MGKIAVLPLDDEEWLVAPKTSARSIRSGRELGIRATHYRTKTTEGLLEVARCVYEAHNRWYAPWKAIGRPKRKVRDKYRLSAARQWQDFLTETGWKFSKHAKLIGRLAQIGERAQLLKSNSANLPNSLEALALLTGKALTNKVVERVASQLSAASTAHDTLQAIESVTGTRAVKSVAGRDGADLARYVRDGSDRAIVLRAALIALGEVLNIRAPSESDDRTMFVIEALRDSNEVQALGKLLARLVSELRETESESIRAELEKLRLRKPRRNRVASGIIVDP
jgi:hypothetical protein